MAMQELQSGSPVCIPVKLKTYLMAEIHDWGPHKPWMIAYRAKQGVNIEN